MKTNHEVTEKTLITYLCVSIKDWTKDQLIRYEALIPYLHKELIEKTLGEWEGRDSGITEKEITTYFNVVSNKKEQVGEFIKQSISDFCLDGFVSFDFSENESEAPNFRSELEQVKVVDWSWALKRNY